jgi:hypothetical protein
VHAVIGEHDLIVVAAKLAHVFGDLFEPGRGRLRIELCGRQLDDPVARARELVEQRVEERVRDERDSARAGIGAQRSSASRRARSSAGS